MKKVLIAEHSEEELRALEALLGEHCAVRTCRDGAAALELLRDHAPDIFVLDLALTQLDGLALLEQLHDFSPRPMLLVTADITSGYVMTRLQQLGVDYVMRRPCQVQTLYERICDFLAQLRQAPIEQPAQERLLGAMLLRLGVCAKLDGFDYLMTAIPFYLRDTAQSLTKELYVSVADACHSDAQLVERSMRTAIERAWRSRDERVWQQYFPCAKNGLVPRPTNGEFIARLAHLLEGKCVGFDTANA